MKNLFIEINNITNEELSKINPKINGIVLLEILKYKILERLIDKKSDLSFENVEDVSNASIIEHESRKLELKLVSCKSPIININSVLKTNLLLIVINEFIDINIEDHKTKKIFNYKCFPMTSIVLSKGSKCSFSYSKNAIFFEYCDKEIDTNIEKF